MPIKITTENNIMTAFLSGEIDHHSAAALREAIDNEIHNRRPEHLRLDFGDVTFMDSSGIGLIMGRYRLISEYGGRLSVQGTSPVNARMIKLAGLGRLGIEGI